MLAFEELLLHYPEGDPYRFTVLVSLGNSYEATGAHSKAENCFEKVLRSAHVAEADKTAAREGLVRNRGKLHYETGQYEEAAATFEEALTYYQKDDPDRPAALLWLGHSYFGAGNYAKARECYEEILASPHATEADKASTRESLVRLPQSPKKTFH